VITVLEIQLAHVAAASFLHLCRNLEDFLQARNFEDQLKVMDTDGFTDPVEHARRLGIKLD